MRVIVFDRELHEPLTVVEMPFDLFERGKRGERIRMIPEQLLDERALREWMSPATEVPHIEWQFITLRLEEVRKGRGGETLFWFAYADNETLALRLRAAFLPGQVGELRVQRQRAWADGVMLQPPPR